MENGNEVNKILNKSGNDYILSPSGIKLKKEDEGYRVEYEDIKAVEISTLPEGATFLVSNGIIDKMFSFDDYLLFIANNDRVCLSFVELAPKDSEELNLSPDLYYDLRAELPKKYLGIFVASEVSRCEDCGAITVTNHVQVVANTLESALEKVKSTFLLAECELDHLDRKLEKLLQKTVKCLK